jgi:methylenetetrahydrofolate dehydrogenase (NADP+)/methenyltetrahydrofolate cyclohydrolase
MGTIIYGNELAAELKVGMKEKIDAWKAAGKRVPCLAVVLVGDDPASQVYVHGKEKACASVGIESRTTHLPADAKQEDLEKLIHALNEDPAVDGILVQLPLPKGLDEKKAILTIDPAKDVDGLHPMNVGMFYTGNPSFVPCTPLACMELLKKAGCDPKGKRAVVVGRSLLVGAPVARLLQNANATVTICHSRTVDLASVCREADILIAATGRPKMITKDYVKPGACVIDVGISRQEDGKLCGDVDPSVQEIAGAITPVPKGVGPMTICMLLHNTIQAYEGRER